MMSLFLAVSCQKPADDAVQYGTVEFCLENAAVDGADTKALHGEVDVNEFAVTMVSTASTFEYRYGDIVDAGNEVTVPVGIYTVSAENVTDEESISLPDIWGQARYAAKTQPTPVVGGGSVHIGLVCRMTNSALVVTFADNIQEYFTDVEVKAYTSSSRKLEYNIANSASAVGYFTPAPLYYEFTAVRKNGLTPVSYSGSISLESATNHYLNFRTVEPVGVLDFSITVDTEFEKVYETIFVDPGAE